MKFKTIQIAISACAVLAVGIPFASAQTSGEEVSVGSSNVGDKDTRSKEKIVQDAHAALDRMEAASNNISRMLRTAREAKDVVKTLCLDDKLNQINVAVRSASDRVASIEAAASSGNVERIQHDDAVLGALSNRGSELAAEANQCIGEEGGIVGESELNVTVDPAIPQGEVAIPAPTSVISFPPAASSPTI